LKKISNRRIKKLLIQNGIDRKTIKNILKNNGAFKDVFNSPTPDIKISNEELLMITKFLKLKS